MLIKINDKITFKTKVPFEVKQTTNNSKEIEVFWNNYLKENPNSYNGDILVVTKITKDLDRYTIEIGKAKYADVLYAKKNGNLTCFSLFSAILLKTKDNYYLLVKNNNNRINILGGMAEEKDFSDKNSYLENCLERELKKELGLSLKEKNDIINYEPKYLKIPTQGEKSNSCGIIYIGNLNYTKTQIEEYFQKNKNKFDKEVKELLFYTKDNYLELLNEPVKASYLVEFIEKMIKEECE